MEKEYNIYELHAELIRYYNKYEDMKSTYNKVKWILPFINFINKLMFWKRFTIAKVKPVKQSRKRFKINFYDLDPFTIGKSYVNTVEDRKELQDSFYNYKEENDYFDKKLDYKTIKWTEL